MWDVVSRKLAKYLRLDTLMGKFYIEYIFGVFLYKWCNTESTQTPEGG